MLAYSVRISAFPVLSAALLACGPSPETELALGAGGARLVADDAGLALLRDDRVQVRFAAEAFEVAVVRSVDPTASGDPWWWVHPSELLRSEPPPDHRWLAPTGWSPRLDGDRILVDLVYPGRVEGTLSLSLAAPGRWRARFEVRGPNPFVHRRITATVDENEAFYGLGEWFDTPTHRGQRRPMQLEPDLRLEGATNEGHVPIPFLLGSQGWGWFVESRRYGYFDVAHQRDDAVTIVYAADERFDFWLFSEAYPLDLTHHYHQVTGAPAMPDQWAYGPWIWRDENDDQAQLLDDVRKIRELDLATSAIWIDRPYARAVNTFDFVDAKWPDPREMVRSVRSAGLRLALWHTPYLEEATGALRAEAVQAGYFPPQVGLRANPWSELLDLSNPVAKRWWQDKLQYYIDLGVEGFKLDYAEDIVPGPGGGRFAWTFANGEDERTMHHDYSGLYHSTYAELLPASGGFLLCRAGRWGGQTHASVIWPGDLNAGFQRHLEPLPDGRLAVGGLPAAVFAALGLGPSGFPLFGSDTGGYRDSPPDEETFLRWAQHTAFSAVMQVGDSSSQPPWAFTPENGRNERTLDLYRDLARWHLRLFPYVWTAVLESHVRGRAVLRPVGLAHPEVGVHPEADYLLGPDLLVAPVIERGARRRSVQFPPGRWLSFWTDGVVSEGPGGAVEVEAPLEAIPVFVRAGAILALLAPDVDTLAPATDPGVVSAAGPETPVWLRVAGPPAQATRIELFDGSVARLESDGAAWRASWSRGTRFGPASFELRGWSKPARVTSRGALVPEQASTIEPGWRWEDGVLYLTGLDEARIEG